MNDELTQQAREVAEQLRSRQLKLAAAESCTGGWIAKVLTDIAGSSEWFERGFVTYSNQAKQEMLGVEAGTLRAHGAVSEAVVREMVSGALAHSQADLALSVSGIAGPGGGSVEKPVGTVWFGWQRRGGEALATCYCFAGDREAVRRQAVLTALQGVLELL
ncbi:nicotinamide-nucleotide amidase [Sedimenticola thiotaurini]|uniref:Damage-inducible protein CinA n=1 Tax=Sedimenticola thiotaurini TaxID=1543721 RepID=A0A0F7K1Y4_9GAMM|nr:nicotinamide-nucleotide amidase [Sedimenticola thiotaurini]AKH21922.1 damage-inducible protein CinA [Sedimenticola thiotaurini]